MPPRKILLMYSTHRPGSAHLEALRGLDDDICVVAAGSEESAQKEAVDAEIIIGHRYLRQCLPSARSLKWVQTTAGGLDRLPLESLAEKGVMLTRCTVPSSVIARHAHTLAWALLRNIPAAMHNAGRKLGDPRWLPHPRGALIFGMGRIGCELAALLQRDGIEVWGVKRRPEIRPAGCDCHLVEQWMDVLPRADLCFLCLPLSAETHHFLDEAALSRLPDHAVVVNVGRGGILDERALYDLLSSGRLGGAGLDVLAPDSPFAEAVGLKNLNCMVTPHISSHYFERTPGLEAFVERQVTAYLREEPLQDLVDLSERAHG